MRRSVTEKESHAVTMKKKKMSKTMILKVRSKSLPTAVQVSSFSCGGLFLFILVLRESYDHRYIHTCTVRYGICNQTCQMCQSTWTRNSADSIITTGLYEYA